MSAFFSFFQRPFPDHGVDATGANTYATVVTTTKLCRYVHVSVGANGCIVSLDGGTTDHFALPANSERLFPDLAVVSGSIIQAKNLVTDSNYTNCHISAW